MINQRKLLSKLKQLFSKRYIDRSFKPISVYKPKAISLSNSLAQKNPNFDTCVRKFHPICQTTQAYVINHTQQIEAFGQTFECVVFDENKNLLPFSSYWKPTLRSHTPIELNNIKFKNVHTEPHIYLGLIQPMPGLFHFLLETLPRLWVTNSEHKDYKIAINKTNQDSSKLWTKPQYNEYLKVLGFTEEKITIIDQPTLFEHLIIPSPAAILSPQEAFYSTELINFWQKLHNKLNTQNINSPELVYLSRRQVNKPNHGEQRRLINETEVEEVFKELGFTVVYPEQLTSESEKHSLLKNCKFIAGTGGSGLLQAAFFPKCKDVLVLENFQHFPFTVRHQLMMSVLHNQNIHIFDTAVPDDSRKSMVNTTELRKYVANIIR